MGRKFFAQIAQALAKGKLIFFDTPLSEVLRGRWRELVPRDFSSLRQPGGRKDLDNFVLITAPYCLLDSRRSLETLPIRKSRHELHFCIQHFAWPADFLFDDVRACERDFYSHYFPPTLVGEFALFYCKRRIPVGTEAPGGVVKTVVTPCMPGVVWGCRRGCRVNGGNHLHTGARSGLLS